MADEKFTLIALLAASALALAAMPMHNEPAEARIWHSEDRLPNGEADFCFDYATLNRLFVDGDASNNYRKVKTSVEKSMARYNNLLASELDLSTVASCQRGDYSVYGKDMAPWGFSAQATYPDNTGDKFVRYNTWRAWGTDGGCFNLLGHVFAYNIEWITNHELGHVVGLAHYPPGSASTMVHQCSTTWADIQGTDATNIAGEY